MALFQSQKELADFVLAERSIFVQCPSCESIHRLNELRVFYGETPPKDLLDKLEDAEEEFEENKKAIIAKAIERSKSVYIGKTLEHLAPTVLGWGHQPRDCRFMAEPIDFISFDGLFETNEVRKITFIEAKTGKSNLSGRQRSIRDAIESKQVYFEQFNMPTQ